MFDFDWWLKNKAKRENTIVSAFITVKIDYNKLETDFMPDLKSPMLQVESQGLT